MTNSRPETYEELQSRLHSDDHGQLSFSRSYELADDFGARGTCDICGKAIVDSEAFAEAVGTHYGLSDEQREEFEAEIFDSGLEVGDFDNSSVCAYHGEQLRKPD